MKCFHNCIVHTAHSTMHHNIESKQSDRATQREQMDKKNERTKRKNDYGSTKVYYLCCAYPFGVREITNTHCLNILFCSRDFAFIVASLVQMLLASTHTQINKLQKEARRRSRKRKKCTWLVCQTLWVRCSAPNSFIYYYVHTPHMRYAAAAAPWHERNQQQQQQMEKMKRKKIREDEVDEEEDEVTSR